ncbi:MAG: hypothetical protein EOO77_26455 [Oxalobacteraceae bacterium]|nr:MAG: hypothetical protein EOO77_26455 [Oxalobacteraceae bacterium]
MKRYLMFVLTFLGASPAFADPAPRTLGREKVKQTTSYIDALHKKGLRRYDNITVKDVDAKCSHYCIRIEDNSGPVTVKGGTWRHNGTPDKISGVFANVNGRMIVDGVTATGNYDPKVTPKARFPNEDGIMAAQRTFLTVNGGTFRDFWDAGIDTKATTVMTGTVTVENSRVSLKVWGPLVGDTLVSRNPRDGNVSCLQSPVVTCNIYLKKLVVWDTNPNGLLIGFQGSDGVVAIGACELHVPSTYRVRWDKVGNKNTKIFLGPSCVKGGKVVVASPAPTSPQLRR